MSDTKNFATVKREHYKTLQLYVPIVARVHGGTHPEFLKVQDVFKTMEAKIKEAGRKTPALDEEFLALREITAHYAVPSDVCESYEAVYVMLKDLDDAYHQG